MADYSKWDCVGDSDDEQEETQDAPELAEREGEGQLQREADRWLRAQISVLHLGSVPAPGAPPELEDMIPPRRVSDEERLVLARLMAITRHDNVARHRDILSLARQNQWLEEDTGVVELLCCLHQKLSGSLNNGTDPSLVRMFEMLVGTINLLAAPEKCGCSGGYGKIHRLFALIGDPQTEDARELRAKFNKMEFAAHAIFNSIDPHGCEGTASPGLYDDRPMDWTSACCWAGLAALVLLCAAGLCLHLLRQRLPEGPPSPWAPPGTGPREPGAEL